MGSSPNGKTHRQIHVAVVFAQGFHHLREAVVDRNVQCRTPGGVQNIRVGPFADKEPGHVRLIPGLHKGGEEK